MKYTFLVVIEHATLLTYHIGDPERAAALFFKIGAADAPIRFPPRQLKDYRNQRHLLEVSVLLDNWNIDGLSTTHLY